MLSAALYLFFLCWLPAANAQELVLESASTPTSSGGAPTYVTNADGSITTSPEIGDLTDGTMTMGDCVGGASHLNLIPSTSNQWGGNALQWGACADSFALGIAINEALSDAGTGISLDKIHYRWKYINGCFNITKSDGTEVYCDADISSRLDENFKPTGEYADQLDTLNIVVTLTDAAGNVVKTKTYDYDTWYSWYEENAHSLNEENENGSVWQIEQDYMEIFNHLTGSGTIYTPAQLGDITFVTTAQDNGQWEGYYGPVVKGGSMWFTYRNNPCDLDTLYNPTCPGYAEAYVIHLYDKACAANVLYDIGCPGYAPAYLIQQCTINSLYSVECPMYQIAYFNQQCDLDGQYDMACPNYIAPVEESISDPIADIISIPNLPVAPPIIDVIIPTIIPQIEIPVQIVIPEIIVVVEPEITIASLEAELEEIIINEPRSEEPIESSDTNEPGSGDVGGGTEESGTESGSEPESESQEKPAEPEKNDEPESDTDGKSKESSDDESSEPESDDGEEKDTGEDTGSEDGDGNDKEVDEGEDADKAVESEEDATKPEKKEKKPEPTEEEKKDSRKKKIKALVAIKIAGIKEKIDDADTIEDQMKMQAQLLALIAFVPDFDYGEMEVPDTYFYPPEPTVDHAFSRWFVNDPNFGIMEDLQYPNLR